MKLGEKRLAKMKANLIAFEEEVGVPLRQTPRLCLSDCPFENFAPDECEYGEYDCCYTDGDVYYESGYFTSYTKEESDWWSNLSLSRREAYTQEIIKWLKEK